LLEAASRSNSDRSGTLATREDAAIAELPSAFEDIGLIFAV
jgi:hypothetical protein